MIRHPIISGNNGGDEYFFQQNNSSSHYENSYMSSRNPETNVNRGTSHIFYKTRMCQKFLEGICPNGHSCTFAHGPTDLRHPPPNWQEIVNRGGANWNDDQKIIHRMRICRKFYNGDQCPYGEKCNFLHESPAKFKVEAAMDTNRTRESSVISIKTVADPFQPEGGHSLRSNTDVIQVCTVTTDPDDLRASVKGTYWKTKICSKWETTELNMTNAVGPNAVSMAHCSTAESAPTDPTVAVPVPHGEVKGFGKWKLAHKKLNRIYGDWIDDEKDKSSIAD